MEIKITEEQARQYFSAVIGSENIEESKRGLGIRERMEEIYRSGTYRLVPATNQTVFGAYAAVLDWCDTEKTVRVSKQRPDEKEARLHTKISGATAKQKAHAHAFAWKMCEFDVGEE